ncbi:MAG: EpsG family protein, partial [Pseudomonadota bacterium]|nr:EpsG family protein [Pseudomonadota bacterium]
MIPFWLMFLIPAWALLVPGRLPQREAAAAWFAVGAVFAVLMGFRHEVGGDWFVYLPHFQDAARTGLLEILGGSDPGYYGLSWLV